MAIVRTEEVKAVVPADRFTVKVGDLVRNHSDSTCGNVSRIRLVTAKGLISLENGEVQWKFFSSETEPLQIPTRVYEPLPSGTVVTLIQE